MHPKNRTRYKTLDRLAKDERVVEIWDEGDDGLWILLREDVFTLEGGHVLHERTVKDLVKSFRYDLRED